MPWYYHDGERECGPISSAELRKLAAAGKIDGGNLVRKRRDKPWARARRVIGLFPDNAVGSARPGGAPKQSPAGPEAAGPGERPDQAPPPQPPRRTAGFGSHLLRRLPARLLIVAALLGTAGPVLAILTWRNLRQSERTLPSASARSDRTQPTILPPAVGEPDGRLGSDGGRSRSR